MSTSPSGFGSPELPSRCAEAGDGSAALFDDGRTITIVARTPVIDALIEAGRMGVTGLKGE